MSLDRVSQGLIHQNDIAIATADSFPFNKAAFLQILYYSLHGSFRNANFDCDFPQHFLRVGGSTVRT